MKVFVYDPTATDELSKVRGIGRYIQTLKEILPKNTVFTSDLTKVPHDSVLINPFINFTQPPVINSRIAHKQIAIIHDVITLQFPEHFPTGIKGKFNLLLNKQSLKHYNVIVTDTNTSKKNIIARLGIGEGQIRVIPPTILQDFVTQREVDGSYKVTSDDYVIYVGDVTWNKNLVTIANAVKQADISCVMVGKAFLNITDNPWMKEAFEFKKLVEGDNHFVFPGFVSDDELRSLYKKAVANILISREEGFGYSFFEAATQKTPSILSDIDIFHETAGDAAIFVDLNSSDAVVKAIQKLSKDKTLRKGLGQKASERLQWLSRSADLWKDLLLSQQTGQ